MAPRGPKIDECLASWHPEVPKLTNVSRVGSNLAPRGGGGDAAPGAPGFRVIHIRAIALGRGHCKLGVSPAFGRTPDATACFPGRELSLGFEIAKDCDFEFRV